MTIDEMVEAWLLEKFFESGDYDKAEHGAAKSIKVMLVDMGWECGCWSEWTREDSFEMVGKFVGERGGFTWKYGRWADLPTFIEELDSYQDRDCPYDEGD